jgi:hypothetical protein
LIFLMSITMGQSTSNLKCLYRSSWFTHTHTPTRARDGPRTPSPTQADAAAPIHQLRQSHTRLWFAQLRRRHGRPDSREKAMGGGGGGESDRGSGKNVIRDRCGVCSPLTPSRGRESSSSPRNECAHPSLPSETGDFLNYNGAVQTSCEETRGACGQGFTGCARPAAQERGV